MKSQADKATAFRALHARTGAFIIPNPWDAGTARILAYLGFEALATTSMGFAFTLGRPDYGVTRDEVLAHITAIAAATDLPVSADLEGGFGDAPKTAAETIRMAAAAGVVGGSIEDATGRSDDPIYDKELAADRVRAAAEAAHSLPFPFTLTGRAENYLHGRPDLKDTIVRLQLYQEAGADVLYAPGLNTREEIAEVLRSVDRPVNVLAGRPPHLTLSELSAMGVRRVSVGGGLCRATIAGFLNAAREMREQGTFEFGKTATPSAELTRMLESFL